MSSPAARHLRFRTASWVHDAVRRLDDDDNAAIARAFAAEKAGRSSRRRRRRRPAPKRRRTWWSSTAMPAGGGEAAMQTATRPAPSPGSPKEAPAMTLAEFLDGL